MKSVPNLISYLHEFFWNFYQSLAIYFELFSSRVNFNSEITDERAPPVRRSACAVAVWLPRAAPLTRLKAAIGTARRASRQPHAACLPIAPRLPRARRRQPHPHASRRVRRQPRTCHRSLTRVAAASPHALSPDRLTPHTARLTDRAAIPTEPPSQPPRSKATDTVRRRAARRSPVDVAPHHRPRSGEPPVPWPSLVRRRRAAVGSPSSAAAARTRVVRHALPGPTELGRARCTARGRARFRPSGTRFKFYIF
jgi:hypothetical protein